MSWTVPTSVTRAGCVGLNPGSPPVRILHRHLGACSLACKMGMRHPPLELLQDQTSSRTCDRVRACRTLLGRLSHHPRFPVPGSVLFLEPFPVPTQTCQLSPPPRVCSAHLISGSLSFPIAYLSPFLPPDHPKSPRDPAAVLSPSPSSQTAPTTLPPTPDTPPPPQHKPGRTVHLMFYCKNVKINYI